MGTPAVSHLKLLVPKLYVEAKTPVFTPFLYRSTDQPIFLRNGYLPHRWGILLFTPPPGSRARRLGWSQYMHECVGASQGYQGVRVRVRFRVRARVSWGGWWVLGELPRPVGWLVGSWRWGMYGYLPHRCGDSAVPVAAPRQDRLGCTIDPMIALRRANTLVHVL